MSNTTYLKKGDQWKILFLSLILFFPHLGQATNYHQQTAPKSEAQADAVATSGDSQSHSVVTVGAGPAVPNDITIHGLAPLGLAPHNNTARCIKVWGIASGNKNAQGILGIPQRDKECDLQKAADDAFAQGQIGLGWYFKCNMRSIKKLYKQWPKAERRDACVADVKKQLVVSPIEKENTYLRNTIESMKNREIDQLRGRIYELESMLK